MDRSDTKPETTPDTTAAAVRKAYKTPQLRRLGSVRELTLGSKGSKGDGGGTLIGNQGGGKGM